MTNHELGADPEKDEVVYKKAQLIGLWDHVFFENGKNKSPLYFRDGRPVTRDMLMAMEPHLISFAKSNGFDLGKMSTEFRREDQDGRENSGDDSKPIEDLTQMKRLMLLSARAFFEDFGPEDFFR